MLKTHLDKVEKHLLWQWPILVVTVTTRSNFLFQTEDSSIHQDKNIYIWYYPNEIENGFFVVKI